MNDWLEDAIEQHFFSDGGVEIDEEFLLCLTDDDMLDLIWQYMKFEMKKAEELADSHRRFCISSN